MKKETIKKCVIITVLAGLVLSCLWKPLIPEKKEAGTFQSSKKEEKNHPVVVIDAGHGGIDPGKVGVSGAYEKDINLSIAGYVKEALEKKQITVLMTRESDTGLYSEGEPGKKLADMQARMEIMNRPEVDIIVSIHQNSFTDSSSKGAQVFYQSSSEEGERLAKMLQEKLVSGVDSENHRQIKANNSYFILKKSIKPAVIVECGFLSNPEEEALLLQKEYQKKVANAIRDGIIAYFSLSTQ